MQKWRRSNVPAQHRIQALLEEAFVLAEDAAADAAAEPGKRRDVYVNVAVILEAVLRALEPDADRAKFGALPTAAREVIEEHPKTRTVYRAVGGPIERPVGGAITQRSDDAKLLVRVAECFSIAHKASRLAAAPAEREQSLHAMEECLFLVVNTLQAKPHSFGRFKVGNTRVINADWFKALEAVRREVTKTLNREDCSAKTIAIAALVAWGIPRARAKDMLKHS